LDGIIHSDAGQLAWIKGGASAVIQADMQSRGAIPADVLRNLAGSKVLAAAVAPTVAQLTAAKHLSPRVGSRPLVLQFNSKTVN